MRFAIYLVGGVALLSSGSLWLVGWRTPFANQYLSFATTPQFSNDTARAQRTTERPTSTPPPTLFPPPLVTEDAPPTLSKKQHNYSTDILKNSTLEPLCMAKVGRLGRRDFYGGNFNRIIQLSNLLSLRNDSQKVALSPGWTDWYNQWLDPIKESNGEDVIMFRRQGGPCAISILPKDLHFLHPFSDGNPNVVNLIPKQTIRQEAEAAVKQFLSDHKASSFISVHRRHLGGSGAAKEGLPDPTKCASINKDGIYDYCLDNLDANNNQVRANISREEMGSYCDLTYTTVAEDLKRYGQDSLPVLLFSDGSVPAFDSTFPYHDKNSLEVQSWMMTLSTVHYGNPMSSIDYVVNHWRRGRPSRPEQCYKGYHDVVAPHVQQTRDITSNDK